MDIFTTNLQPEIRESRRHPLPAEGVERFEAGDSETQGNSEGVASEWRPNNGDRRDVRDFIRQCKKGSNKHVIVDGHPRYYDKAYTVTKPRPYSPEYLAFIRGI